MVNMSLRILSKPSEEQLANIFKVNFPQHCTQRQHPPGARV
jgi:hypothetical protein